MDITKTSDSQSGLAVPSMPIITFSSFQAMHKQGFRKTFILGNVCCCCCLLFSVLFPEMSSQSSFGTTCPPERTIEWDPLRRRPRRVPPRPHNRRPFRPIATIRPETHPTSMSSRYRRLTLELFVQMPSIRSISVLFPSLRGTCRYCYRPAGFVREF